MGSIMGAALRLIFGRRPKPALDQEQGHGVSAYGDDPVLDSQTTPHRTLVSNRDPLVMFRLLVGISTAPMLGLVSTSSRPAPNLGIYTRVVRQEQKARDSYKVFAFVINLCFGLQIIVAALLTALGAANASHVVITALGAINTVIAGFLTYLKGSGLPMRLKYYADEWKRVREYIEQRERDFSREGCPLSVYEVVATIEKMYIDTKTEIEMNTPDSYNSNAGVKGNERGGGPLDKIKVLATKLNSKSQPPAQDSVARADTTCTPQTDQRVENKELHDLLAMTQRAKDDLALQGQHVVVEAGKKDAQDLPQRSQDGETSLARQLDRHSTQLM
jgi:hypothetical protein